MLDLAALGNRAEQRTGPRAAVREPSLNRLAPTSGCVDEPVLPTLPAAHRDGALVEVVELQRDGFTAA